VSQCWEAVTRIWEIVRVLHVVVPARYRGEEGGSKNRCSINFSIVKIF
jgi:hypothetical protein